MVDVKSQPLIVEGKMERYIELVRQARNRIVTELKKVTDEHWVSQATSAPTPNDVSVKLEKYMRPLFADDVEMAAIGLADMFVLSVLIADAHTSDPTVNVLDDAIQVAGQLLEASGNESVSAPTPSDMWMVFEADYNKLLKRKNHQYLLGRDFGWYVKDAIVRYVDTNSRLVNTETNEVIHYGSIESVLIEEGDTLYNSWRMYVQEWEELLNVEIL